MSFSLEVNGSKVDNETRCTHYHSDLDVIAIKFKCCQTYYSCFFCHEESVAHVPEIWKREEFDTFAILCGVCKTEMSINQYLNCAAQCPNCLVRFNPKCSNHYHFYFDV